MRKLRNKKMISKSFLGVSLISFMVLFLMVIVMLFFIYSEMNKNYQRLNQTSMSNIDIVFTNHIKEAINKAESWYVSPQGMKCRTKEDYSPIEDIHFLKELQDELVVTPYIHSIYFLNRYNEISLHIGDNCNFTEDLEDLFLQKLEEVQGKKNTYSWTVKNRYEGKVDVPLLTIYYQESFNKHSRYLGTIFINIDMVELSKSIFSTANQNTQYYILDDEKRVVLSNQVSSCGEDWSSKEYILKLLQSDGNSLVINEESVNWEISAMPSSVKGYYIISRTEHIGIFNTLHQFYPIVMLIVIVLSLFIIGVSMIVSIWLYKPFGQLVAKIKQSEYVDEEDDEIEEIQMVERLFGRLDGHISVLNKKNENDLLVKTFLAGSWNADMQKILIDNNVVETNHGYYIVMVYVGKSEELISNGNEVLNMIESVYSSILEEYGKCTCLNLSEDRFLLFISETKGNLIQEELMNVLRNARKLSVDMYGNRVFSLVCGYVQDGREIFTIPFEQLDSTLKLRMLIEEDKVAVYGNCVNYEELESAANRIVDAAKCGDKEKYDSSVEKYLDCCSDINYQTFLMQTADVAERMQKLHNKVRVENNNIVYNHGEFRRQIRAMTKRSQLLAWLDDLYRDVNLQIKRIKKYTAESGIEKAVEYIQNNYGNPDLNVDMLADMLGISSAYCGKKFKEYVGVGAMEYIAKIRIEKAREMLIEMPDKEIAQIAKDVGFSNQGYFATKFKDFYGVSPSKFRDFNSVNRINND